MLPDFSRFDLVKRLGAGYCGEVYLCRDKQDQKLYAVKILKADEEWRQTTMWKEMQAQELFNSPFCIGLHASFRTNTMMCNVYELKAGKALDWDWPHNKKRKDDFQLKVFCGAMALGIKHMHEKGVVHLDGHPANMMTDEKGYPVWIDFGCSQTGITKPNSGCNTHVVGWPGG